MADEQMLIAYRHDEHKTRGGSHAAGVRSIGGVTVNEEVPWGADRAAGDLSRPGGKPQQVMPTGDETHYRRSLLTGETAYDAKSVSLARLEPELDRLFTIEDAESIHTEWLASDIVSLFNESWAYPYTSLKYHTLLVAALLDCYRNGHAFDDLYLRVTDEVVPHRTVFDGGGWALTITPEAGDGQARLGSRPWQNWTSVWGRLSAHPFDTAERMWMVLDAQLRRIRSWSTALQYIEDYQSQGWVQ